MKAGFKTMGKGFIWLLLLILLVAFAGCGGGGGGTTAISGKVIDGPVSNASITVYQVTSTGFVKAGTGSTGADGSFSLNIPGYNSSDYYILYVSGGTFENNKVSTGAPDMVGFLAPGGSHQVFITPVTTLIGEQLFSNGVLNQNLTAAQVQADIQQMLAALENMFQALGNNSAGSISSADPTGQSGLGQLIAELNGLLQDIANNVSGESYAQAMADLANYIANNPTSFSAALQAADAGSGSFSLANFTVTGGSGGTTTISGMLSSNDQTGLHTLMTMPGIPAGLFATAGNNQVSLSWTASGAASYNVYRGTSSGALGTKIKIKTGATSASYTDTTAVNGTTYYYQVTAVNSSGESAGSTQVSATPSSGPGSGSSTLSGHVYSGPSTPVSGSTVTLYSVASSGSPSVLGSASSNSSGTFNISYTNPGGSNILFLTAAGGNAGAGANSGIILAAVAGQAASQPSSVTINELTTVMAVAVVGVPTGSISSATNYLPGNASRTVLNRTAELLFLVNAGTGQFAPLPSGFVLSTDDLDALADILSSCVESASGSQACSNLYADSVPSGGTAPTNTLAAISDIYQNMPSLNLGALTGLIPSAPPYTTQYSTSNAIPWNAVPNGLVVLNISGNGLNYAMWTTMDPAGNIWVADWEYDIGSGTNHLTEIPVTNGVPGLPSIKMTGNYATFNPVKITSDSSGNIWLSNDIWPPNVPAGPAVTEVPMKNGLPGTPVNITGSSITFPGPITADPAGNIWASNLNNNTITEIPVSGGTPVTPAAVATVPGGTGSYPAAITSDSAGNIWLSDGWVSNNYGYVTEIPVSNGTPGAAVNITIPPYAGAITSDPSGNIWVTDYSGANYGTPTLTEIPMSNGTPGAPVNITGGNWTNGFIVSAPNGDIWMINEGHAYAGYQLTKFPVTNGVAGTSASMLIPGLYGAVHLILDKNGNFWVTVDTQPSTTIGGSRNNSVFVIMGGVAP